MMKHIVAWNLKSNLNETQKEDVKKEIERQLEALIPVIPEIIELKVITNIMKSSTVDIVLETVFQSTKELIVYRDHPQHVKVGQYIATVVEQRTAIDYEM